MPHRERDLAALVNQAREGDQEAARKLVEEWGHHLWRVIRRKLRKELESVYDPEDFEQDVWKSFFAHVIHEHCVETPGELLHLLGVIARNKVVEANRHFARQKCDARRTQPLGSLSPAETETLVDRQPTPDLAAGKKEQWAGLLRGLPPHHQRMVQLVCEGYTHTEVAKMLGFCEKTVHRVIEAAVRTLFPLGEK